MLEMGSTAAQAPPGYAPQPPPHTAYFAPAAPTFQTQKPPQTIAFQSPPQETQWMLSQQQNWIPQRPRQSGGSRASNSGKIQKKIGQNYNPNGQQWQKNFGASPNVAYKQHHQGGHTQPPNPLWQTPGQQVQHPGHHRNQQPFGNNIKEHLNMMYCFTCGYDVDRVGFQCQCAKAGHIPNMTRNQAHAVWRAFMKGHHKTLPDGTGAGMGWILANNLQKSNYTIDKNQQA